MDNQTPAKILLGKLTLTPHTQEDILNAIRDSSRESPTLTLVTPNIFHLHLAERDVEVAAAIEAADISVPDGWPIVRLLTTYRNDIRPRIAGSDLSLAVLELAHVERLSVLIIGGSDSSLRDAISNTRNKYPNAEVIAPSSNLTLPNVPTESSLQNLVEVINQAAPDIVLLCLGAPKSELHAFRARNHLNARMVLCVGATVDFLSEHKFRAPKLIQQLRLEWAYRLAQEPRRLFRRYFSSGLTFIRVSATLRREQRTPSQESRGGHYE